MEGPSFPGGMPDDPLYDSSYQHSHVTPKYLGVESRKPISPHNAYQMNGYQAPTYSHAPPPPPQARFRVDGSNLDYSKQSTEHFSESSGAYASTDHNPYEKPDVFDNIASQLLNLHSKNERKYPLQRKSIDELLNQVFTTADEQRAFAKAYRCRLFDLPTFPESGEASTSALIRNVEKLYGEALKNRKDQYHPATHPASPPTTVTSRDTNKSVFPSEPASSSYPSSTVYGSPQVPHPHGRPQQSRYIEDSSLSVNADQSSWNFGKPVQSPYENKHDESLPQPSNPYGNIQPPPQNHNTPSLSQSKLDHTINTGIKRGLNMNTYGPRSPHDDANMVKQANKQQRDTDVYQEESTDERDDGNGMVYTLDPEQMTTNLRSPSKTSTQEMGECFTYQSEASVTASTFTQDTGDRKIKLQQKQAILHNCDPAEDFQSKMKQHLLDEMEHASLVLQTTTNKEARAQHLRHMKNLRLQWENLKKLSPQQAKVGVNAEMSNMQPKKNEDTLPEKNTQAELVVMPRISYKSVTPHTRESIQQSGCEKSVYSNLADDMSTVSFPSNRPMGKQVADVVAPESLPAHFIFEARLGNQVFLATVPEGGVTKGQVFSSVMLDIDHNIDERTVRARILMDMGIPRERWRDDLFDCFMNGAAHPLILNSIFCPHIAVSQILARLRLSSKGERGLPLNARTKVSNILWLMSGLIFMHSLYAYFLLRAQQSIYLYAFAAIPLLALDLSLFFYIVFLTMRARKEIRREFNIPALRCGRYEDFCISFWFLSCTMAQMGRHTADYDTYRAACCTDTGLPNHVEVKLPSDPV